MNPRRQKRLMVVSVIVLLVGGAISLMLYALSQNIDLFYTPSEILMVKKARSLKWVNDYASVAWWCLAPLSAIKKR